MFWPPGCHGVSGDATAENLQTNRVKLAKTSRISCPSPHRGWARNGKGDEGKACSVFPGFVKVCMKSNWCLQSPEFLSEYDRRVEKI